MLQAILGAAELASSLYGASQANKAAKKQLAFQKEQFAWQKQIQQEQLDMAKEMQRAGFATQVDGNGNVQYYDKASNTWKTVLSPTQKQLQDASDREQLQQLGPDATMAREGRLLNARRRGQEGQVADAQLATYADRQSRGGRYNPSAIESALRLSREQAVNQGFDQVQSALTQQALRSGAGGVADIGSKLARARSQQIASTMGNPYVESLEEAQKLNSGDSADTLNQYNLLATRASNVDNPNFTPANVGAAASSSLLGARTLAQNGQAGAINAIGSGADRVMRAADNVDYTMGGQAGGFWAGLGDLLGSFNFGGPSGVPSGNRYTQSANAMIANNDKLKAAGL